MACRNGQRNLRRRPPSRHNASYKLRAERKWFINELERSVRLVHTPTSSETLLVTQVVSTCEQLRLEDTPFALLPSRIGFAQAIDNAAAAVILARSSFDGFNGNSTKAMRQYSAALTSLQRLLDDPSQCFSDQALLSAFLLALYEKTRPGLAGKPGDVEQSQAHHRDGVTVMLLARARQHGNVSEVVRAIFYQAWISIFMVPITLGIPSPYDTPIFHSLDPPAHWNLPPDFAIMRKTSQQILVRLPELNTALRQLRSERTQFSSAKIRRAMKVAHVLVSHRAVDAEDSVLHQLRVIKSADETCNFMPVMFALKDSLVERRAAHMYWTIRALCAQMYLSLIDLGICANLDCDAQALRKEKLRMATNIIMCWQEPHADSRVHIRSGRHGLAPSLSAAWAALKDQDTFRGAPISEVKNWMLRRLAGPEKDTDSGLTAIEAQFDRSVDFLIGGPMSWSEGGTFKLYETSIYELI